MLRIATLNDVPEMLAIYTPYVENTTVSFEYTPPSLEDHNNHNQSYDHNQYKDLHIHSHSH